MKAKRVNIYLPSELHARHVAIAAAKNMDFSEYLRELMIADNAGEKSDTSIASDIKGIRAALEKMAGSSQAGADATNEGAGERAVVDSLKAAMRPKAIARSKSA